MENKWQQQPVAQLIAEQKLFIGDGYRAKNEELGTKGLPFARAGNIDGGFHFEDVDRFPEENLHRVGNKVSQTGDVVFTSKGTVGRFAFVRHDTPRFVYSPQLCFWRSLDEHHISPRYLYYWISSREFFVQFKSVAGKTDMAEYVSLTDQRQMHITLPSLPEQETIANILGPLDDKIKLNKRKNETLEAMARALFMSWFVDFDPIRAKAEGGKTGLPKHVSDLFPNSFEDTELGKIPKGWVIVTVDNFAEIVGGGTPNTKNEAFWNGGIHRWATPKDLSNLETPVLFETERRITDAGLAEIGSGLLPVGTVLLSSRAPIGYLAVAEKPVAINQGFIAMKPRNNHYSLFLLFWARWAHETILSRANGSTFLEISKTNFRPIQLVKAPEFIFENFDSIAHASYRQIVRNECEIRNLTELRDTLLPKLLSGELKIHNAEKMVERGI